MNIFMFFQHGEKVFRHGRDLPHWQQVGTIQFITFRLADAMPQKKLTNWKEERDSWLAWNPKPWSDRQQNEHRRLFHEKLEEWLDEGAGSCLLAEKSNRVILADVLMKAHGDKASFESFVIMPNHVHLLVQPFVELEKLIKIWKGVSARKIGKGSIWQGNYRDTMIRDAEHFRNTVRYIRKNPKHLKSEEFTLWEGKSAKTIPSLEQGHSCL
ncbi:transposase [Roseibacillus persicicus]|uniref:Transposase IS200-like domain-containing protein n=2 Tax=Roseibacillus persicicus TaxID=454148 RepID=A0A918TEH3_9BACT|nr:hypothetical protein GCM10007100_05710 [Roseibacillus persicicus]